MICPFSATGHLHTPTRSPSPPFRSLPSTRLPRRFNSHADKPAPSRNLRGGGGRFNRNDGEKSGSLPPNAQPADYRSCNSAICIVGYANGRMVGRTPNSNSRESGLERASRVDTRINISREFRILIFFFFLILPLSSLTLFRYCYVYIYIYICNRFRFTGKLKDS